MTIITTGISVANIMKMMAKWSPRRPYLHDCSEIKIINYRMKNKNNDSDNLKPEEINIDATIDSVKNKK